MTDLTPAQASDMFRRPPDRLLDVGAGEAAYRRVGSGPDVLFVHGWPVSGATFRKLLPWLADKVTCHVIDLPSAGSSRFDEHTTLSVDQHITSVKRVVDILGLEDVALVGHNSGGLIARHAMAGDERLRAMGLINTEPLEVSWRFKAFLMARNLPGFAAGLGWVAGQPKIRRNGFVLGDAFADRSLLDGEFDEFFLRPLHEDRARLRAAVRVLKTFDHELIERFPEVHRKITAPVQLVWGDQDPFFPVAQARPMVGSFPNAKLDIIQGAGLFSHEERPEEVARSLLAAIG